MSSEELQWRSPGPCPSCGVVTNHIWFTDLLGVVPDPLTGAATQHHMRGEQGILLVSKCVIASCQALALWIESHTEPRSEADLVWPQTGVRIPPEDGLEDKEAKLYREAAAIERMSPRAARSLLRALLEAFLKRHLNDAGHSVESKKLVGLIDLAVKQLDLSQTLKKGLTAVRAQGNTALHDLTDEASTEDLRWLFRAVDELVEELYVRPQKWADLAGIRNDDEPF